MKQERKYTFWQRLIAALANQHPGIRFRDKSEPYIPEGAYDLEVFDVKPCPEGKPGKEAFIGFKTVDGNFNFIQVPFTDKTF